MLHLSSASLNQKKKTKLIVQTFLSLPFPHVTLFLFSKCISGSRLWIYLSGKIFQLSCFLSNIKNYLFFLPLELMLLQENKTMYKKDHHEDLKIGLPRLARVIPCMQVSLYQEVVDDTQHHLHISINHFPM